MLRKYLWEYIKIRYKQPSVWGINLPGRVPGPFKKSLCRRIWNVWPRARSPGAIHAGSLHKEKPCRAETGLCVQPTLGQRQAEAGRWPWLQCPSLHPNPGKALQRQGPQARLTQCPELRNMKSRVTGTFKVLTCPRSALQRSQGQV